MRTIVHISDLHFGRTETALEEALRGTIMARQPDLIIVSGDLTQRATRAQFAEAKKFFASLPYPILIVPGNHDVPLYSFWTRFTRPYAKYREHISDDLEPLFQDDEMLVVGINTVRIFKMKEGRVNAKQIERARSILMSTPAEKIKIIVSHHPFNIPVGHYKRPLSQARKFWKELEAMGVDLFLSGHLHDTLERYRDRAYKLSSAGPLLIQAGTAISTRTRKEGNSFNVIRITSRTMRIERYAAHHERRDFSVVRTEEFTRNKTGWQRKETAV
ncbi:MAG: metallophosphoesterase [Undibacterium sp.]